MYTYFKLFIRSVKRNKLFSMVNIFGLSIGFFASILIYMYVQNELSYDKFHENGERIYRVNQTFIWGDDNPNLFSSTGPGVGFAISEEIPEVKQVIRVHTPNMMPVRFNEEGKEKFFNDEYLLAVDSAFLTTFSYPLLHGDKETALLKPNSVVLSEETSIRFFGEENPVGRTLDLSGGPMRQSYLVTGVTKKSIGNSYIDFDMLISLNSIDRMKTSDWNWMWTMFETFILLDDNANPQVVQQKLDQLPKKHAEQTLKVMGYSYEEYIAAGKEWNLYLQPFEDIYLGSANIYNRLGAVGNFKIVAALIGSAIFLIILSCINFINLSTAQFTARAKDVALRKVLGSSKSTLVKRFFGETLVYCLAAAFLAITIIYYTIPVINQSLGTSLAFSLIQQPELPIFILSLIICVSMIAGFYPFLFFNAFKPIAAMKGEFKTGKKGVSLRNGMLIAQYVLSFLLITGTLTIYKQLNHFMNADLGFDKENLISVENVHWTGSPKEFANELEKMEGVTGVSLCDALPMLVSNGDQFNPDRPEGGSIPLNYALGDEKYIDILDIDMVVGRAFDDSFSDDVNGIVINETAAETIGWAVDESILNKKITNWSGEYHVIGVARDFYFWSLHTPIEPFAIFHAESNAQGERPLTRIMLKSVSSASELEKLKTDMEATWNEFAPNRTFEIIEINEQFESSFRTEARFGSVLSFFAILTIIIASLGLFGIVVFSIEQKLKEIGVRKVLGASISSIIILFSKSYVKLLVVAFLISLVPSYYFMENWLSDFEYRINLSPILFISALAILLVISLSISIFHSLRASLMNPSEVLKDE